MTLSEKIISGALSGGWGTGEGFLARRRRERREQTEKRADLLARPDLLEKRVADVAQTLSLSKRRLRTRKYGSKLAALEAQTEGTPQEGFASELLAEYTAALENPKYLEVSDRQLLAKVATGLMNVPDEEGKTRIEKAYRHKWRADTSFGNVFGLFGEDKSVKKFPGYEEWLAKEKVKPTDEWHTGAAEAAAWGSGTTAALMAGSAAIGRAGFAIPHPAAKIIGAGLMAIPEFMAIDAVRNVLHKTEWARSREGSWKAYVPAAIGVVGGMYAGHKAVTTTIKKAAEKSILSKGMTDLLMKDPTAANAIRAGEAQKVAKAAQARVDRIMPKYISREDVLKSQFKTAEDYLEAVRGKTRGRIAEFDDRALEKARKEFQAIPMTAGGAEVGGVTMQRVLEPFTKGLEVTGVARPRHRSDIIRAYTEGLEAAEIRAAERTAKRKRGSGEMLLQAFEEAAGRTKPVSRKKASRIFTKELSDEETEAALKKAGKTGRLRDAIVKQRRLKELKERQKIRREISEKSKKAVSRERTKARKKKKLQSKISTKAARLNLLKERHRILKEKKAKVEAEAITKVETEAVGKEFKNTINLERAGLVETAKGGVEEHMGGFLDDTVEDLVDLFKDSGKLFGIGALAAGTTALLGAEKTEASPGSTLIKMGLKAGKKLVPKFKNTQEALLFGEKATKEGKIVDLVTKPVRDFSKKLKADLSIRAQETLNKVEAYKKWQFEVGEKVRSKSTKQTYEITNKTWDKKNDRPMYGYKGVSTEESGQFIAEKAHKSLEPLRGPKVIDKTLYTGTALIGSIPLASLFVPDSVEASGFSRLGVGVPRVIAEVLKEAPTKVKMNKLAKDMKDAGLLHIPVAKGAKEVKYTQSTISTAKLAVEKNNNLVKNIKAENSPFGRWLTKKFSPYTTSNLLYEINPMPEVGNLQSAIGNNVMNFLTVTGNILRDVPGLVKKGTAEAIEKTMSPLAKKYSKNVIAYRAVTTEIEKLEKPLRKLYKALKKEGGIQHRPAIEKIEAKRASLLVAKEELGPIFNRFTKEWESKMRELAPKYATTRVSLACEDTAEYTKYPWLKSLMKPEEEEAVVWLKNIFESYKGRMAAAGHDVIKEPYCHHALHPDWLEKGAKEVLEGFGLDSKAIPFTKFFHRAKYSRMMMPDINYTMQKYLIDAEKRIQWSKFWGKGKKDSWYAHRRWVETFGSEDQKMFWRELTDAAIPPAPTKANIAANIYSSFEVLRLLGLSPSVALKHYFKNIGTSSTMGVGNFLSHLPEAATTAIKGAKNSPELKQIYKLMGIKSPKGKRKVFDEVADSFITQIHRMNMVADLDFEAVIPHKAGFWRAFTDKVQSLNKWGSIPVRMIESVDRHHTILAAWEAAAKKGMTAQQATYGIYNNILRLNFLSGACNPAWVRNPKIRAILLFQNTAFKIMERRLITAWRAGRDVKTALGVIRHQDIQKTLAEMAEVGKCVLGGERALKQNLIFDALTSTKGFFGTPVIKQAMTEAILSGGIIMGGGIAGMNLWPQVWHVPFLRHGAKAPTLATNPFINAVFRTVGEREEAEDYGIEKDFLMTAMLKNWLKSSGYIPQTANKILRISKQDVPDVYRGSKMAYFFSVPAKEEF